MDRATRQKTLALVVVGAAVLVGGRLFRPVLGAKEHVTLECRLPPSPQERRVDLTLEREGKAIRTLSIPVAAQQDSAAPEVELRPGHYTVQALSSATGRVVQARADFDVPGAAPVLMLSALPGGNP